MNTISAENTVTVDCGASFLKGALFQNGVMTRSRQLSAPLNVQADPFDPAGIKRLTEAVRDLIAELSAGLPEAAVSIANEMHGFLLADENGEPVTDYISWQREFIGREAVQNRLTATAGSEHAQIMLRHTGMPVRSGLPSSNLLWLVSENRLPEGKTLYFYTLGDFIVRTLTGKAPCCHLTNAAATGLCDLTVPAWNRDLIGIITGGYSGRIVFPEISSSAVQYRNGDTLLTVLPAIGDQQAALLGSGLQSPHTVSFNMGTGAQVSRMTDSLSFGDYQLRPYFYGQYIKTVPHIPCGRALNVFFRFVRDILRKVQPDISDAEVWRILSESAGSCTAPDAPVVSLSFFENACEAQSGGSISEIGEYGLTPESLMTGVICRMAQNFAEAAGRLLGRTEPEITSVVFSGGIAARWPVLREQIIRRTGLEVPVTVSDSDTMYGCLRYAELSCPQAG